MPSGVLRMFAECLGRNVGARSQLECRVPDDSHGRASLCQCFSVTLAFWWVLLILNCVSSCVLSLQTAQTVLLLVAAFALCWLPHHVIAMWVEFGAFPLDDASFAFRIIAHCLSYGNSCINPVLYAFLSENFRQACRQVFACRFLCAPPPDNKVIRFRTENYSSTHSSTNIWRK